MSITKPKQQRPVVGASTDLWGMILNGNMDLMDNFASDVVDELGTHSQELARLEQDKINMADLDTVVADRVDNYIETDAKPQLDAYINNEKKPELDSYTVQKKSDINNHVETVSKVDINNFTEVQKIELDTHELIKEGELDTHELVKEGELDSHTLTKQAQLDAYETSKEGELEAFTVVKKAEMNTYKDSMNSEVNIFAEGKKVEITQHTESKKAELDTYEDNKEAELDAFTLVKEGQIDSYVLNKKVEIDTKTEEEKLELDAYNEVKKSQLDTHEATKEVRLDTYADGREAEMTVYADAEIDRINATGIAGKLDKGNYMGTAETLKTDIDNNTTITANKLDKATYDADKIITDNRTITAGNGLTGGGKISDNPKIDIISANDSIIINQDSIELNIVDDLITDSPTRAVSARQAVILADMIKNNDSKLDKGNYDGTAETLKTDIDQNKSDILSLQNEIDSKGYNNFKGEYNPYITYSDGDVVYMRGHEIAYVYEFTDVGFSDPTRYTETRKDYQIQDVMYYRYDGTKWEIIFDESHEVNLNLYTIAHQPPTQNYVSTWDNYFPYSDIGRWLCNKDVGTPIKKLDKVDSSKYKDGTASDWTGSSGDIMVKIPKFYCNYTFTSKGRRIRFYSYNNPVGKVALDSYVHPAFDFENKIAENIFIGATKGVIIENQLRSCIGGVANTKTKASFLDLARQGRNVNYTLNTFSNMNLVRDLFLMEFGNTNSQDVVGNGRVNTTSAVNSGVTKILGDRSGRYNTDVSNGNVSYRGLEDWWGNIWEFLNGLLVNDSGYYYTNNVLKMDDISKMTKLSVGTILTEGDSFIREYAKIENYPHIGVPVKTGASATSYYCDNFWYHKAGQVNVTLFGAHWSYGLSAGASCLALTYSASSASSTIGARLAFFI